MVGQDVSVVLSPDQWRRKLSLAWRVRASVAGDGTTSARTVRSARSKGAFDNVDRLDFGPEVAVRSSSLGLEGRIDQLDAIDAKKLRITEYKTGNALDEKGALKEPHRLQLGAYALAVRTILGSRADSIEIRVFSAEGQKDFRFDETWAREVEDALHSLDRGIPKGQRVNSTDLASPGDICAGCSFRPRCSRYLEASMLEPKNAAWPLDTWGPVVDARRHAPGLSEVKVLLGTRGSATIFGVPEKWVMNERGMVDFLAAFSLARMERDSNRDRPNNFVVIDCQTPYRSAFAATRYESLESQGEM
jgi:hypothetical protein